MQYAKLEGEYDFGLCENKAIKKEKNSYFYKANGKGFGLGMNCHA
jgi:hypothetical protein